MQHEVTIEIDRPIEAVFAYTNDHVAEWSLTVVANDVVDDRGGVGTTFRCVTEERGRRMEFDGRVTQWDPPRSSTVYLTGRSFDIEARYVFADLGGGRTAVTQVGKVRPKGFMKVFLFLFGWAFHKAACKAAQAEFDSLKRHCEAQA